ncbi:MAG: cyclic nucleotide-binding domain-containing protein [Spirochaetes bacterium]|nr:cyclic nucleotide-binding domain-containing protein [Spirochaetota bacterium]
MEKIEILKNTGIFTDLEKKELEMVSQLCQVKEFEENTEIFHEGDTGQELFILIEGRVVIEIHLKLKSEKAAVHTVDKGHVFGEVALVDGGPRSASATTVKPSRLLVLNKTDLDKLIETNPRIGYIILRNFSKILCGRIRKTTRELRSSLIFA